MYVLYAAPLRPGMPQDRLTYWNKTEISVGTFVHVQIGTAIVEAIVIGCEDLRAKKQEIRNSSFGIKHIQAEMKIRPLSEKSALSLYELSLLSGQTIGDYVVGFLGLDAHRLSNLYTSKETKTSELYIESDLVQRAQTYIQKQKEYTSHMIIVVPSSGHADTLERILVAQGSTPLVFHSNQTRRQQEQTNVRLASGTPHICICTPQACGKLLDNTHLVVIECFYSHLYQINFTTTFNGAKSLYAFLRLMNIPVQLADSHRIPGMRDIPASISGTSSLPSLYIADMKDGIQVKNTYFSMAILEYIRNKAKGEKLVLYINRKGIAPQLVCNDCNSTVLCTYCKHPLALMADELHGRYTLCTSCKKETNLFEGRELICAACGSFKISQIGLATDSVQAELTKLGFESLVFDSNHVRTYAQAKKRIQEFYLGDRDILIATEMVLPHLLPKYQYICVLSIDPLIHHKNYRADFEIRDTVYRLAFVSKNRELLLQTRYITHLEKILLTPEVEYLEKSNAELQACMYPPYVYEISLSTKKDTSYFAHLLENTRIRSLVTKHGQIYTIKLRTQELEMAIALIREYIEMRKELHLSIN